LNLRVSKRSGHGNLAKPGLICEADFRAANQRAAVSAFLYTQQVSKKLIFSEKQLLDAFFNAWSLKRLYWKAKYL
jgi:hypothetical protein